MDPLTPDADIGLQLDALLERGHEIERDLRELSDLPTVEPEEGSTGETAARAREWMRVEEALREEAHLKLGLREMEHFEEISYLQTHEAPAPDWRRLLALKIGFRLERLRKLQGSRAR